MTRWCTRSPPSKSICGVDHSCYHMQQQMTNRLPDIRRCSHVLVAARNSGRRYHKSFAAVRRWSRAGVTVGVSKDAVFLGWPACCRCICGFGDPGSCGGMQSRPRVRRSAPVEPAAGAIAAHERAWDAALRACASDWRTRKPCGAEGLPSRLDRHQGRKIPDFQPFPAGIA